MELNRILSSVWLIRREIKIILKSYFKNMLSDVSVLTDFCEEEDEGEILTHKIK